MPVETQRKRNREENMNMNQKIMKFANINSHVRLQSTASQEMEQALYPSRQMECN
jgi:hypothetical protein